MSYKFIFDTNVLDNKSVKDLRNAGVISACDSGRFAFYMTPILLKERLHFVAKGKIHPEAVEAVKLLVELKWQRVFNETGGQSGIFTKELEGSSQDDYLFMDYQPIKNALRLFLNGGEFPDEGKKIITEEDEQWEPKKKANAVVYKGMREDITKKLQKNKFLLRKESAFNSFLKINFEPTAIDKIQQSIDSTIPKEKLVEYWRKHNMLCPYFNKFIEGWLFIPWHFMVVEQEPKIDPNTHEDIEHLVYLLDLDGIVSNEKGFIRAACKALYPNKDFLSVEEFISRMKR